MDNFKPMAAVGRGMRKDRGMFVYWLFYFVFFLRNQEFTYIHTAMLQGP